MLKRIVTLTIVTLLLVGMTLPVFGLSRSGVYVLDEAGELPYDMRGRLNRQAKDLCQALDVDIVYVRTKEQDLSNRAQKLRLGSRYDQVMLIENDESVRIFFFGKALMLKTEDRQELLQTYRSHEQTASAIKAYLEMAKKIIQQRASQGAFKNVPEEYLEKLPRLEDRAGMLKSAEKKALQSKLDQISQRYKVDVLLLTLEALDQEPRLIGKDYYENNSFGSGKFHSCILLIVCKNDHWIYTFGEGATAITEDGQNHILYKLQKALKKDKFALAFDRYADLCNSFLAQASIGEPYDGRNMPKDQFPLLLSVSISLTIGILAGSVAVFIHARRLKSVRFHSGAEIYHDVSQWKMTENKDYYLYSETETRIRSR